MTCNNCGAEDWLDNHCTYCNSIHPGWETWGWVNGMFVRIEE